MSSDLPYRPCVGIMLFNHDGLVFVGKRIDQTVEGWQMPQGGIDEGETPRQAVLRELREEVGTDKAEIIGEMENWLTYDLPPHLVGVAFHGRFKGQRQKWFALRFTGQDPDIDITAHEPEFAEWKWLALEALPQLIVPFKRDTYQQVIESFRNLALPSAPAADAASRRNS
jgi:putative (di)nucleoside polyphosphate hydrolase